MGKEEVREYFRKLGGLEQYDEFEVSMQRRWVLPALADTTVVIASAAFVLHVVAEMAQGRPDNAIGYMAYISLALTTRFWSRLSGGNT